MRLPLQMRLRHCLLAQRRQSSSYVSATHRMSSASHALNQSIFELACTSATRELRPYNPNQTPLQALWLEPLDRLWAIVDVFDESLPQRVKQRQCR